MRSFVLRARPVGPRPRPRAGIGIVVGIMVLLLLPAGSLALGPIGAGSSQDLRTEAAARAASVARPPVPSSLSSNFTFPFGTDTSPCVAAPAAQTSPGPGHAILPSALRSTYGVNALLNRTPGSTDFPVGQAVGVLAWGWGYDPTDLSTFFSTYYPSDFPRPKVIAVPIDGAPIPGPNSAADPSGGSCELTIDVEWAASMAPGATIYVVYAPPGTQQPYYSPTDGSILDALNWTVTLGNLTSLSLSFGEPQGENASLERAMDTDFQELSTDGTTVFAASGDDGGAANSPPGAFCRNGPAINFPAASPYVVAVGGTNATGTGAESAWDLSGGGPSALPSDPAPAWQELGSSAGFAQSLEEREVPDVSASAEDNAFYFASSLLMANGTSFASPTWAGIVADMAQSDATRFGELDPSLYALGALEESRAAPASGLVDITSGSNCFFVAQPGWDPVTGWGTPSALELATSLEGATFQPLTVTVSPSSSVAAGSTVGVKVSVPITDESGLIGTPLTVVVLSAKNDSPILRLFGKVPSPGAASSWGANFVLPSSLDQAWVNITAYAQNGSTWALGSTVLTEPGPPPGAGPSVLDLLIEYQLPLLVGILILFLAYRILTERRRGRTVTGPSPAEVAGQPAATGSTDSPDAASAAAAGASTVAEASRGSATMTPFCWKCGANLKGTERSCPSCGTRFS